MASMGFPRNKWTYILAGILLIILWIVYESFLPALIVTVLTFLGLYILFIILAKLF